MKTITFEGKQYEVEDWVKWVAMDKYGSIWVFSDKPVYSKNLNVWLRKYKTKALCIFKPNENWQDSLTEV